MQEHDLAVFNFEESVLIYSNLQKLYDKAWVLKKMALSYKAQNAFSKAISCLQNALAIHESMPVEKQNKNEMEYVKGILESLRQKRYQPKPGNRRYHSQNSVAH